jgi:hypothetical protein
MRPCASLLSSHSKSYLDLDTGGSIRGEVGAALLPDSSRTPPRLLPDSSRTAPGLLPDYLEEEAGAGGGIHGVALFVCMVKHCLYVTVGAAAGGGTRLSIVCMYG